ncbi:hypothetical protein B0I35DRAFT_404040 [Stachybotrys elegans]|uniref:Uncharacterized protein n=1 Tax=Stachybotrys elegans TaxID=80388 RepID=A0A8K0SZ06_9HYPO|nr:hypothetical protein B0I35DRAFT_404040 [Stachybotrys elegans]
MARGSRPPPLNLSVDTRPKNLPQICRDSTENELTPLMVVTEVASVEEKMPTRSHRQAGPMARTVRVASDVTHGIICVLLVSIMVTFIHDQAQSGSLEASACAFTLIFALTSDTALDVKSITTYNRDWTTQCLLVRLVLTLMYIALLISFAVMRGVFPTGYAYWTVPPEIADALVVICLGTIVLWNIAHLGIWYQGSLRSVVPSRDRWRGMA